MSVRVLTISTLFPNTVRPAFGGFVANQMANLAARGDVELTILAPVGLPHWPLSLREPYRSLAHIEEEGDWHGMRVLRPRFRLVPRMGDSNPGRLAHALLPVASRLHAEQPFDVVDAQFFFPDGPAAAQVATALGLPFSITARGSDIHWWGKRPAALEQMLAAAKQAAGILAVSKALRRDMIALGMPAETIGVNYTGLDHTRFQPLPRKAARALVSAIPELGVWAGGHLVVTPGALIPIKGQRLVIEALTALPGTHLALAGEGADEAGLRTFVEDLGLTDRVQFLGQVSHELMPQLLAAADVVVLPSEREGLANAWVEALACGTPLVIPDVGGASEVVQDPSAGRLVERTPIAIAEAIAALLADPPAQADVARNAERFSWEANAAELAAHFHLLAGK